MVGSFEVVNGDVRDNGADHVTGICRVYENLTPIKKAPLNQVTEN